MEETPLPHGTHVCVCVCRRAGNGLQQDSTGNRSREWSVPSEGDTGRAVYRVTVWVLSWISNVGECFMSFSPPPPPLLQPHAPFTAFPPPPLLSFQVTQSLHCTQGVVITGAAEIGQDKGTLPAQDVFPLSSLFFFNQPLPSPFLFSLRFSCHPIPYFSHICCTLFTHVSSILAHFPPHISRSLSKQVLFFNGKTSHS